MIQKLLKLMSIKQFKRLPLKQSKSIPCLKCYRRIILALLAVALAFLQLPMFIPNSRAETVEPATEIYYKFITGVVFLWGDTTKPDSWDPAAPDSQYTVKTDAILPAGASNVSLFAFDPATFDLDTAPNVEGRKDSNYYLSHYYPYAVNSLAINLDGVSTGGSTSKTIHYSYTMRLTPQQSLYNVREKLEQPGGEQEIRDLMEYVSPTMEQFLEKDKERVFGDSIAAYLYFVPYLIQYELAADTPPPVVATPPAINGTAILVLPEYAYEGHPVPARDRSTFLVDGTEYSAQRLYAEGLGDNTFSILESGAGFWKRLTSTLAEMRFSISGFYHVRLDVETAAGDTLRDTELIQIKATPAIEDGLTGTQKQNRRQDLILRIATHPDYPLTEAVVTIEDPTSGESLQQEFNQATVLIDGKTVRSGDPVISAGENTDGLKMRQMKLDSLATDEYFTSLDLPFLTKPSKPGATESKTYRYTIQVEDSRGETDSVTKTFVVQPDLAPAPIISIDKSYLRQKGLNLAEIQVEDMTISEDGDGFLRFWEYTPASVTELPDGGVAFDEASSTNPVPISTLPDYEALSFGTDKKVGFLKEGVGAFCVGLTITDHWTAPTLEEFITSDDILISKTKAYSQVDNVAPVISRLTQKIVNSSLLLIAGGQEEYDGMTAAKSEFLQEFLRNGIDAQIQYARLLGNTPAFVTDVTALQTWSHPYGVEANGSINEPEMFSVDDTKFYQTLFTWPKSDGTNGVGAYPGAPVRVVAYDPYTGSQAWVYTTMDANHFSMGHDDTGSYLYLIYSGRTVLLDKKTGTIAGEIPFSLGKQNFLTDRLLYTSNGSSIIQIDISTLTSKTVWNGAQGVRRIGNKLHFFTAGSDAISRGVLDLASASVTRERLYGKAETPYFTASSFQCLGIDAAGSMVLWKNTGYAGDADRGFRVYDIHNRLQFSVEKAAQGSSSPVMALDEDGICNYVAVMEQVQSSSCTQYMTAFNIHNGSTASNSISQSSSLGYPTNGLIAAFETNNRGYFIYGSSWVYIVNYGLYTGQKHYTFAYDGGGSLSKSVSGPANLDVAEEYGAVSDRFAAFFLGDNTLGNAYMRTKVLTWPKNMSGEMAQVLYRFAETGSENMEDRKQIILYDNTNHDLLGSVERSVHRILETGHSFLFAVDSGNSVTASIQNYGSRIAALTNGIAKLIAEGTESIADVIKQTVLEKAQGYQPALQVTVTNPEGISQAGILVKTLKLQPGRQYFYEYDLKKLPGDGEESTEATDTTESTGMTDSTDSSVSLMYSSFQINKAFSDDQLLPGKYYVTKTVEEDFNDGTIDPFFTASGGSSGGRFGVFGGSGGTRNLLRGGSASIQFTVPEGKKAIAMMDFAMYHDDQGWQGGISIDGQRFFNNQWNNTTDSTYSGTYNHPLLLMQGVHTIGISMSYYGYGTVSYYSAIDNLRVVFLDETKPGASEQHDGFALTNDWERKNGSFTAPNARLSYGAQTLTYRNGGVPGMANGTYRTDYTILIPDGSIGKVLAYPEGSAWGTGPTGPYFYIGGKNVYMLPESNYLWKRISSGQQVFVGNLTGSNLNYSVGAYRSSGSIPRFEQFLYPSSPTASADKIFFSKQSNGIRDGESLTDTGGWDRVYLENESADGTVDLRIEFPSAEGVTRYLLQNLKLYYYEKGIKTYVEDLNITALTQIDTWIPGNNTSLSMATALPGEEASDSDSLVFRKGQMVNFPISYSDYENDPSKRGYFRYLHEPWNDGLLPDAAAQLGESGAIVGGPGAGEQIPVDGRPASVNPAVTKVLSAPIKRFYKDGKYVLQHWQEDDTSRNLGTVWGTELTAPPYDKLSNVEEITFYIEGSGEAPWITYIKTIPSEVEEGEGYRLEIGVDDTEKDELRLRTEVYLKGVLVFAHNKTGIQADLSGTYPPVTTDEAPLAQAGVYQVVCTVRDANGAGLETYRFTVISKGKITGVVSHTDLWDDNRKRYNLARFGSEANEPVVFDEYIKMPEPRLRGTNVYWSGEKLMLEAAVAGQPSSVNAKIIEVPGDDEATAEDTVPAYNTVLLNSGKKNAAGETIYSGALWDASMISLWGKKIPQQITVRFTAAYDGELALTFDVPIIFDNSSTYWNLHRVW